MRPASKMSRPPRSERLTSKGRPRRQAAKTHFFKYQLTGNPNRAAKNDLKRALQESLEEHKGTPNGKGTISSNKNSNNDSNDIINSRVIINSSTNSSDLSRASNNSSTSNGSRSSSSSISVKTKRTRSTLQTVTTTTPPPLTKRSRLMDEQRQQQQGQVYCKDYKSNCDNDPSVLSGSASMSAPQVNKAIRTYSRSQPNQNGQQTMNRDEGPRSSTPLTKKTTASDGRGTPSLKNSQTYVSRSTQTLTPQLVLIKTKPIDKSIDAKYQKSNSPRTTNNIPNDNNNSEIPSQPTPVQPQPLIQEQHLKFKRESKNYAYAKMTALKVNTSKSPSSNSKSSNSKKSPPSGILNLNNTNKDSTTSTKITNSSALNNQSSSIMKHTISSQTTNLVKGNAEPKSNLSKKSPSPNNSTKTDRQNGPVEACSKITSSNKQVSHTLIRRDNALMQDSQLLMSGQQVLDVDCSTGFNNDLSSVNQNQANKIDVTKQRAPRGSWSLLGVPEERVIYLRDDEPPKRLICYPAIRHIEGDVIQVRDSVLLRSGAKKTDLPFIAKVCAFWEDAETGYVMMSLFWYYRPEHTEEGRRPHHLLDEIFASRHRDVDSVECIEDKCYVLTFNEYCRYWKRCKMEQVNTTWSLADVTIPVSNETYPRRNRIPESDVNPELVFCCRQIYDSRTRKLLKNPHINTKYGHI